MSLDRDEGATGSSALPPGVRAIVVDDGGARIAAAASSCATANDLGQPQEEAQGRTCRTHRSCPGEGARRR
jgi:hypothetical protein